MGINRKIRFDNQGNLLGSSERPQGVSKETLTDLLSIHGIRVVASSSLPNNTAYMVGESAVMVSNDVYRGLGLWKIEGFSPPEVSESPSRKTRYDIARE